VVNNRTAPNLLCQFGQSPSAGLPVGPTRGYILHHLRASPTMEFPINQLFSWPGTKIADNTNNANIN
jgi:hypothetical protein